MFADSVRRIFNLLKAGKLLSTEEINRSTGMPPRTVRYAINKLKDKNLLIEYRSLRDMRKVKYGVNESVKSL